MTTPLLCLVFFASWTVAIVFVGIGAYRVGSVLLGKRQPKDFPADQAHAGPPVYQRLLRVHQNCVENLPIFGALVLMGHLVGLTDGTFALLCQIYVVARVGQGVAHLSSGRNLAINVRFTFFFTQLFCCIGMIWLLLSVPMAGGGL